MLSSNESIIGKSFGKWMILDEAGKDKKFNKLYKCRCECGTQKIQKLTTLSRSESVQCKSCYLNKLNFMPDIINKKFGNWLVLEKSSIKGSNSYFLCQCSCGTLKEVAGYRLRTNKSKSCPHCRVKVHGMTYTSTHSIWSDMISRCSNQNIKSYKYYGGRGIKVSDKWLIFQNFLSDMGIRPAGLQLDRIDNNGNYELGNCRWVTPQVNVNNRRCSLKKEEK